MEFDEIIFVYHLSLFGNCLKKHKSKNAERRNILIFVILIKCQMMMC